MTKQKWDDVLVYRPGRRSSNTIKWYYLKWRESQAPALPLRCDIAECYFHTNDLFWNGKVIKLILDHINGVNGDNRAKNLRLLCPNCNSQQLTHGGGNKGKTKQHDGGFVLLSSDNKRHYFLPAEAGMYKVDLGDVKFRLGKK